MPRVDLEELKPPRKALPDYPTTFARVRANYGRFKPEYEIHRESFSDWLSHLVDRSGAASLSEIETLLTRTRRRPIEALLQRHFYWSATCFMRAYYLLLAYLTLDRRGIDSWARVTGYYSRFYAAKATCNLCLAGWVFLEPSTSSSVKKGLYLLYTGTSGVRLLPTSQTGALQRRGSHEPWWTLYDQLRRVRDFPDTSALRSGLHQFEFTAEERNELNYSDKWMEGFPELEWFDTSIDQMEAHASFARPRPDRDFTSINRYFEGYDPEFSDEADFFTDSVLSLWYPLLAYLDVLDRLSIEQDLLSYDKLIALARRVLGPDYPRILTGITMVFTQRQGAHKPSSRPRRTRRTN
jgi:hypothetical protein